ncbi:MAG: glycosyltransferase family 2 protein [Bryobacterales bacterium]|nr:glycosyltransferase family 2 protein [Bryobacterales bacterium]
MRVTAVIPNWNRRDLLAGVLRDWRAQTFSGAETIVVDNGSADGSAEMARAMGVETIALPENKGFAHAVNRGIEAAQGDWVAVLNNDVRLPADWLARLLDAAERNGAWFAAGKLLRASEPDIIDGAFDLLSLSACAWRAGNGKPDSALWSQQRAVSFVPFTAALFRRELFDRIGLLDEAFESYLEDVDFGLRCALARYQGVYAGNVAATHLASATLGRWNPETVRRISRNQLLLVAKHYPPGWIRRFGWSILIGQALWGLVAARHGAGLAYLRGKREGVRLLRAGQRQPEPGIEEVLRASQTELEALQRQAGYDWFWRLYFMLT